jgi:hypothetical protein
VIITEEELVLALQSRLKSLGTSQETTDWDAGYQQGILDVAASFGIQIWEL